MLAVIAFFLAAWQKAWFAIGGGARILGLLVVATCDRMIGGGSQS